MIIQRIWLDNALRNFNYIAVCEKTHDALIIDPCDSGVIVAHLKAHNLTPKAIVNTHEHHDHISGNEALKKAYNIPIYAPDTALISADVIIKQGDRIQLGETIDFKVIETPGHTMCHISLLSADDLHLICADTLFNAGVGHCYDGDMDALYQSVHEKLIQLDNQTLIYPGHDYLETNLKFTLNYEPENSKAKALLNEIKEQSPQNRCITTLAQEKDINLFLRVDKPPIQTSIQDAIGRPITDAKACFIALRQLRNNW